MCSPAPVRHLSFGTVRQFSLALVGRYSKLADWPDQGRHRADPPRRIDKGRTLTQETQHLTPHQTRRPGPFCNKQAAASNRARIRQGPAVVDPVVSQGARVPVVPLLPPFWA